MNSGTFHIMNEDEMKSLHQQNMEALDRHGVYTTRASEYPGIMRHERVKFDAVVKIVRDDESIELPSYATDLAAGMDIHAYIHPESLSRGQVEIAPGCTVKIPTGLHFEIPGGYFGALFARSGNAINRGLRLANGVGVLDPDYRGELIVALYNDSSEVAIVHNGDRIAQLVIMPWIHVDIYEVDQLSDTERGSGGLGSTGR